VVKVHQKHTFNEWTWILWAKQLGKKQFVDETITVWNGLWAKRLAIFSIKQANIANMAPERGSAIAKSNFPMYTVKALDGQHFLVAGGGGQAKTGVSNAIVINSFKNLLWNTWQ